MVAIIAPRREPADMIVRHMASQTSMNDSGPRHRPPPSRHRRALGPEWWRNRSRSRPPCCHRQRGFLQRLENARHRIGDRAHDETVEERHCPPGARACDDPPGGQEPGILERAVESLLPDPGLLLHLGQGPRDAPPGVLHRGVERAFRPPPSGGNFMSQICSGDGGCETAHGAISRMGTSGGT